MAHRYDKPDLDTDTGLPRKLGWPIAFKLIAAGVIIANILLGFVLSSILDLRERMARVEATMQMRAEMPHAPVVASNPEAPKPIP